MLLLVSAGTIALKVISMIKVERNLLLSKRNDKKPSSGSADAETVNLFFLEEENEEN
jgi:hypothetical protein